jgi:hypothetical protein
LEHGEWFDDGRRIVYKESVVGVGGFPFLLSLLILLYSKASYDFETTSNLVLSALDFLETNIELLAQFLISYFVINITYA